jgi:malonyl-CoA decarboxylase
MERSDDRISSEPAIRSATITLERVRGWWNRLAAAVLPSRGESGGDRQSARVAAELRQLIEDSRAQRGGEISARERAAQFATIYRAADLPQRAAILSSISHELAPDRANVAAAMAELQAAASAVEQGRAEAHLRLALDAPRATFLAQFNLLPDGVKFLVDLRSDLLGLLPREPGLEVLKVELDGLLERWFDPGFLELQRITWQSPAAVLEKLIAYEAVHPISSWDDLRNRLDADRRCYAFFHPRLPEEPLIFVEIALTKGAPDGIAGLLDEAAPVQDPLAADTAVFYSISSTQSGLRGISFGNLLLKRVLEDLRREFPKLKLFTTLSPIPGFRKWLDGAVAGRQELMPAAEAAKLAAAVGHDRPEAALRDTLARPDWFRDARYAEALRAPMEKLCARYLLREKSGTSPRDPVAQFHLTNGARVNRIVWLADTSERGLRQSYGMMVSYRYNPADVDENHDRFLNGGEIATARRVQRLLG